MLISGAPVSANSGIDAAESGKLLRGLLRDVGSPTFLDTALVDASRVVAGGRDVLRAALEVENAEVRYPPASWGNGTQIVQIDVLVRVELTSTASGTVLYSRKHDYRDTKFAQAVQGQSESQLISRAVYRALDEVFAKDDSLRRSLE